MSFSDFHGNSETVHRLRDMLARKHLPHAVILSGGRGSGKYMLALMLAQALNCLAPPETDGLPDFCGQCANCRRIALSADLDGRFAEAVEAREGMRETDKKETRLFVQTHPDVLVIPPDPPQMMIKVDQVRRVIETIYYRPAEARERVYIFTDSAFMKEAANSLLKVLEEPPEFATIFLLSENPGELLATIRSRSMTFALGAVPVEEVESYLATHHPEWKPRSSARWWRDFAKARWAGLAPSTWMPISRPAPMRWRCSIQRSPVASIRSFSKLQKPIARAPRDATKTEQLLRTLYSLLRDLMFLNSGTPALLHNTDIQSQLTKMAEAADFEWIAASFGSPGRGRAWDAP